MYSNHPSSVRDLLRSMSIPKFSRWPLVVIESYPNFAPFDVLAHYSGIFAPESMPVDPIAATAGAFAGVAVDVSLFPIDTLKTRLQAAGGFLANGGWHGIYKGIGSVSAGSAPSG